MIRERPLTSGLALAVVAYGIGLATFSHAGFPDGMVTGRWMPYLADKPVREDGYYMLTVAWNLASGDGLTYRAGEPTTGIQPLATVIYATLAALVRAAGGDRFTLVRAVIVAGTLNLVLLATLVGRLTARLVARDGPRTRAFHLGFLVTLLSFQTFRLCTAGLETGLYLTLLAALVLRTTGAPPERLRELLAVGALAGLAALARIDLVVVLPVFLALALRDGTLDLRGAVVVAAVAALALAPWLGWVHHVTGGWLPSSGGAQRAFLTAFLAAPRVVAMLVALIEHATPWLMSGGATGPVRLVVALVALVTLFAFRRWCRRGGRVAVPLATAVDPFRSWAAALLVLPVVYLLFFWSFPSYVRYTAPLSLVIVPALVLAVLRRATTDPDRLDRRIAGLLAALFAGTAALSMHSGHVGTTQPILAGVLRDQLPDARHIGTLQSGVIGYFDERTVNLDGKVDHEALAARVAPDPRRALAGLVERKHIDVLVDWPGWIEDNLPTSYLATHFEPCAIDIPEGLATCYRRVPPRPDPARTPSR